jgi:mannose-6-phosphate isomerase
VRGGHAAFTPDPRIVLALDGETRVASGDGDERVLARGEAVFVPFSDGDLTVASSGVAVVAGCPTPARPGRGAGQA